MPRRKAAPPRRCGICGKALWYYQKNGCCYEHGGLMRSLAIRRALPAERRCIVCGGPLVKRPAESWARFAARPSCSWTCGAEWSSAKRIAAQLEAEARRHAP